MSLGDERHFTTYRRVLNRTIWSPLLLSQILYLNVNGNRA